MRQRDTFKCASKKERKKKFQRLEAAQDTPTVQLCKGVLQTLGTCGLKNLENLDYLTPGFLVSEALKELY